GVIRVDVNIQDIDVDQCASGNSWFADTHQCNRTSMECVPIPGRGFRLGQYCCRCKEGFYNPVISNQDSDALPVNSSDACYPSMPVCLPCYPGCGRCQDGAPCRVQEDWLLRTAVLGIQGVFMVLIFVSMMAAYRHRRNKRIRASGLLLLETILFGSLLLYFPVFIMYFRPSTFRCILLRWVRMLGFSIVYGTVTLKMYRVLKVFLSRTAQRVPYMSSLHVMRILAVMLMTVSWFLCAWTVGVLQNRDRNIPVYLPTTTSDGQGFNLCYLDRWDYMMAVAELLFLCWGSSLWTAVRPVPSAFHEPRYMGIAIHNELLLSTMFHLFRFTFPSLHPDWMLLLCFTHTHFTITVTLALLFLPKFLYVSKPGREEIAAEVYEDEVDLRRSYLNNSFTSAWSEHSVDPEDFRDELKKLYAQLEVHKTKKMAANNPHLPKKRSSRCAIGRSIIKRITEFPETVSRQCSREDKDGSFRSRSICHSDSFRRSPDNASISYRSSILTPTPSIRKSQSDHHSIQENQPSLRNTSRLRPDMIKRCSQRSETDSLDMPPGVCKSASAQNLTIDTNLLYPDHTRLHKTWSLTTTPTHSVENITKQDSTTSSRVDVCPWEVQEPKVVKKQESVRADVCPWEEEESQVHNVTKDLSKQDGGSRVNICPWESELPKMVKKQDSSSSKGEVCPWEVQEPKDVKKQDSRAAVCPWESEEPQVVKKQDSGGTNDQKVLKQQEREQANVFIKQESSSARTDVCPWESEEPKVVKKQESISCSKADVCPWEVQEPKEVKKQESISSSKADVCPWEVQEPKEVKKQGSVGSSKTDVCPWEVQESKEVKKQDSRAEVCPWESE
ncbi:hypothetical protein NL108_012287, partial [Boleophthalmus pectinirostris]